MHEALKKISAEVASEFTKWLASAEVKSAIEATRAASDEDAGTFEVVITTENLDRYQEVIRLDGWDLTNYRNNPVVLLSHDSYELPIGVATDLRIEDGKMIASGKFAPASANPKAQQVRQLYDLGILRATSVGFIEKEREGNIITKAELLEFSFVSIPANPYALSTMVKSGLSINDFITKGIVSVKEGEAPEPEKPAEEQTPAEPEEAATVPESEEKKCIECGKTADAPKEAQSDTYPICNSCLMKGWVAIGGGRGIPQLLGQLRTTLVALEAAVKTGEPEGDEDEDDEAGDDERALSEFDEKRRILQLASTVVGEVLAEARRAIEVQK